MPADSEFLAQIDRIAAEKPPLLQQRRLEAHIAPFVELNELFLEAAGRHGSPLYIIDEDMLLKRVHEFKSAFESFLNDVKIFYALKSNNHPSIMQSLVRNGLGMDVSSGSEMLQALVCGSDRIMFSGPGKTREELAQAVSRFEKVTVLLDSFGELDRLQQEAARADIKVVAGVRIAVGSNGPWRKFGIPMERLPDFLNKARKLSNVSIRGLQFHSSWNLMPDNQVKFLQRLGAVLHHLDPALRRGLDFLDIGGGFWPAKGDWNQSRGTSAGELSHHLRLETESPKVHYNYPAAPIGHFAEEIASVLEREIFPLIQCSIHLEPGRWLCQDAMHILMRVVDVKTPDLIITDCGTNAIGRERCDFDYAPIINMSRPSLNEQICWIMGSLCSPHDIWGETYFGDGIQEGDLLLIPAHGAYTYSLRQNFIKPLPRSVIFRKGRIEGADAVKPREEER